MNRKKQNSKSTITTYPWSPEKPKNAEAHRNSMDPAMIMNNLVPYKASALMISPALIELRPIHTWELIEPLMNRTEPSPSSEFTPPA